MSFRINYKFPLITGLNKAEESRNEDLDFEDKNKWKFIKSQIVPPPPRGGGTPLYQVIDTFTSRHHIGCITYPFTLFNINFACCNIQKNYTSSFELS